MLISLLLIRKNVALKSIMDSKIKLGNKNLTEIQVVILNKKSYNLTLYVQHKITLLTTSQINNNGCLFNELEEPGSLLPRFFSERSFSKHFQNN